MSENTNTNTVTLAVTQEAQDIGQRTLSARGQARLLWNERVRHSVRDIEDMLRAIVAQMQAPLDTGKQSKTAVKMVGAHAQASRALRKLATYADALQSETPDTVRVAELFDDLMDTIGRLAAVMPVSIVTRDTVNPNTSRGRIDAIKDCLTGIRDTIRCAQREAVRSVEPDMLPTLERINRAVSDAAVKKLEAAQEREERKQAREAAQAQAAQEAATPATPTPEPEPDTVIGAAMHAAQEARAQRQARKQARAAQSETSGK